jgi:hypothetical protein
MELTQEQKIEKLKQIKEQLRPDVKEFVQQVMNEPIKTTKDNYGTVMSFISSFPKAMQKLFLSMMVEEGYPAITASQVADIMGI